VSARGERHGREKARRRFGGVWGHGWGKSGKGRGIFSRAKFAVEGKKFPFEIQVEGGDIRAAAFARGSGFGGREKVVEGDDSGPQVADAFHTMDFFQPPAMRPISSSFSALKAQESAVRSLRSLASRRR